METAVCCIARKENRYIREFVSWYLDTLAFTKVVIYDNGVGDEESPSEVLGDYISTGCVEVVDWRGYKKNAHVLAYNDFMIKRQMLFDWMAFVDADEFISFDKDSSLKTIDDFLSSPCFNDVDEIKLNWLIHNDNDLMEADYTTQVQERFKEPVHAGDAWPTSNVWLKPIVRGRFADGRCFDNTSGVGSHGICYRYCQLPHKVVTASGMELPVPSDTMTVAINEDTDYNVCFVRHYMFKTIGEYIDRQTIGWPDDVMINDQTVCDKINNVFFAYNRLTDEKSEIIRKRVEGWIPPETSFRILTD